MRVRGGKLEIRKKLRRKSAEKMNRTFEWFRRLETRGQWLESEEKKELRGRGRRHK
jgi:hypothetical protein